MIPSINTTALYVKVAASQLAEAALPFPGGVAWPPLPDSRPRRSSVRASSFSLTSWQMRALTEAGRGWTAARMQKEGVFWDGYEPPERSNFEAKATTEVAQNKIEGGRRGTVLKSWRIKIEDGRQV